MIKDCLLCQANRQDPSKGELTSWPIATRPWDRIHIDFLGPIQAKMYLIITDAYKEWVKVFAMSTTTSVRIEQRFREVFARFGLPRVVVSNNGPQFVLENLKIFFKKNGINHITIPPYHAQSNGAAENFVKTFKTILINNNA